MPRHATSASSISVSKAPGTWRPLRSATGIKRPSCTARPTLLWVDDYKLGLELYRVMFERLGFKVLTAPSGQDALKIVALRHVDLVVTDYEMPGMNGEAVAAAMKSFYPDIPVILFSGSTLVPARVRRVADAFCDKAGSRDQLSSTIFRMLQKKHRHALQPHLITRASDEGRRTVA